MKLKKHFYESDSFNCYLGIEVEYTPKATFDDEPRVEILSIYAIKDTKAVELTSIFEKNFPKFLIDIVENLDWDNEYYLEQYESVD